MDCAPYTHLFVLCSVIALDSKYINMKVGDWNNKTELYNTFKEWIRLKRIIVTSYILRGLYEHKSNSFIV